MILPAGPIASCSEGVGSLRHWTFLDSHTNVRLCSRRGELKKTRPSGWLPCKSRPCPLKALPTEVGVLLWYSEVSRVMQSAGSAFSCPEGAPQAMDIPGRPHDCANAWPASRTEKDEATWTGASQEQGVHASCQHRWQHSLCCKHTKEASSCFFAKNQ